MNRLTEIDTKVYFVKHYIRSAGIVDISCFTQKSQSLRLISWVKSWIMQGILHAQIVQNIISLFFV